MPGSKSGSKSTSSGSKPTSGSLTPLSYADAVISDTSRIDHLEKSMSLLTNEVKAFTSKHDDQAAKYDDTLKMILARLPGTPPSDPSPPEEVSDDVSSLSGQHKNVSFVQPPEAASNMDGSDPNLHLSDSVVDGMSPDPTVTGMTNLQTSKRLNHVTPRSIRRRTSVLSYQQHKKHYTVKTPENGYQAFGHQNKFKIERLNLDHCSLKKDCPISLKAMYHGLSTAAVVSSGNAHHLFPSFDTIDQNFDFLESFLATSANEASADARATFIAIGLKMATRFKSDDFTDANNAPEVNQVIQSNILVDDGWFILQCLFNTIHPKCGALLDNFHPHSDLASLTILPNETMAAFFLRGTDLQNKFEMTRGTPPLFRLIDTIISLLYSAPKLATPMAMFMNAANHHKIACGDDDNTFEFDMMDIQDHLKGHRIKLTHNLNPQHAPADIAALDYCPMASDEYGANISALRTPRRHNPSCEVCFQRHDVDRCPARGSGENKFIHPDALRRGKQYNLTHNEFAPKVPPRAPYPPPRDLPTNKGKSPEASKYRSRPGGKPSMSSYHRATINSLVKDYLEEGSTKEVSNKDFATLNSMATLYLETYDPSQHPVHTLADLENVIDTTTDLPQDQASIASFSAANLCSAIAPSTTPTVATISSTMPLTATPSSLPNSYTEREAIANDSNYAAQISAMTNQDVLDRRDPFRFQMFNSEINYVSNLDIDEEDIDLPQVPNDEASAALATFDSPSQNHDFFLDPALASNVARLPSSASLDSASCSDTLFSDDDSMISHGPVKTDRSSECNHSSLLSIKELLSKDNSFFIDHGDSLMTVISSAIDYGAPPNLMSLYTSGNLNKSQLLNFIRLDSQRWYSPGTPNPGSTLAFPIDLTEGTDPDTAIMIDDPLSPVIAASTNHLDNDPSPHLREATSIVTAPQSNASLGNLAPSLDNGFDGRTLNSFST